MRIDKRFHIPNGSFKEGHYRNGVPDHEKKKSKKDAKTTASEDGSEEMGAPDIEKGTSQPNWEARAREEAREVMN